MDINRFVFSFYLACFLYRKPTDASAGDWSYDGRMSPKYWKDHYPICGGKRQSPIDIKTENVKIDKELGEIDLTSYNFDTRSYNMSLRNNGHSVQVDILTGRPEIHGGGLHGSFKAVQFHFHWGHIDRRGSEHMLNSKASPMEGHIVSVTGLRVEKAGVPGKNHRAATTTYQLSNVITQTVLYIAQQYHTSNSTDRVRLVEDMCILMHIVHYNTKYPDSVTASNKSDGLAVLGFFFKVGGHNSHFNEIIDHLNNVRHRDDSILIHSFPLRQLLPDNLNDFYRYKGSLTTPPCYESVIWTIFQDKIEISENQLNQFRNKVMSNFAGKPEHKLYDDYRPIQSLGDRTVYANNDF